MDLRGRIFGRAAENLEPEQLSGLKDLLNSYGIKVGCLQSSLAKVHLPDAARCEAEARKLEGIIRAADALDCRLVRSFFYWQPPAELAGDLAVRPDAQQKVLDLFAPLAERAKQAGLVLAFENCGVTPDEVSTIVGALDVPSWGLAWDVNNGWDNEARRADEDAFIVNLARQSRLLHVKARGAVKGIEPYVIPYDKVLQICDNGGLRGPVSVEWKVSGKKLNVTITAPKGKGPGQGKDKAPGAGNKGKGKRPGAKKRGGGGKKPGNAGKPDDGTPVDRF